MCAGSPTGGKASHLPAGTESCAWPGNRPEMEMGDGHEIMTSSRRADVGGVPHTARRVNRWSARALRAGRGFLPSTLTSPSDERYRRARRLNGVPRRLTWRRQRCRPEDSWRANPTALGGSSDPRGPLCSWREAPLGGRSTVGALCSSLRKVTTVATSPPTFPPTECGEDAGPGRAAVNWGRACNYAIPWAHHASLVEGQPSASRWVSDGEPGGTDEASRFHYPDASQGPGGPHRPSRCSPPSPPWQPRRIYRRQDRGISAAAAYLQPVGWIRQAARASGRSPHPTSTDAIESLGTEGLAEPLPE